jgi:hypothetical protein
MIWLLLLLLVPGHTLRLLATGGSTAAHVWCTIPGGCRDVIDAELPSSSENKSSPSIQNPGAVVQTIAMEVATD